MNSPFAGEFIGVRNDVLSLLVLLQPKRKPDVKAAEDDCIPSDHPDERQRPRARLQHQDDAKCDRQRTVEDKQPFVLQHAAERDGAPELYCADDDRPDCNEHQQHERGHAGIPKRKDPGEDANHAAKAEPPTRTGVGRRKR